MCSAAYALAREHACHPHSWALGSQDRDTDTSAQQANSSSLLSRGLQDRQGERWRMQSKGHLQFCSANLKRNVDAIAREDLVGTEQACGLQGAPGVTADRATHAVGPAPAAPAKPLSATSPCWCPLLLRVEWPSELRVTGEEPCPVQSRDWCSVNAQSSGSVESVHAG